MNFFKNSLMAIKEMLKRKKNQIDKKIYIKGGRKPWSRGYQASKFELIKKILNNDDMMSKFQNLSTLPEGYGYGYDERLVEYPWTLSRLSDSNCKLLDAGSVFNFQEIVDHPKIDSKDFAIYTLAPENHSFWRRGISYHYGDLRRLPFRDEWFDEIISLSTLGHVGMDNRLYTGQAVEGKIGLEAERAVTELLRVLRPGGKFLISVVFGKHQLIEWSDGSVFAEQFDKSLLKDLLGVFSPCSSVAVNCYKYTKNGWNIANEEECRVLEYFNIHTAKTIDSDNAAAARAVALIEVTK